jgi:hypothetical protein
MKKSKLITIATSLFLGFASTSYASNPDSNFTGTNIQDTKNLRVLDSTETLMNNSEVLLMNSWVKSKLKFSDDLTDKAGYAEAKRIRREAAKARYAGNDAHARYMALESIRIIASSVSKYNLRVAEANDSEQ